jgi:hypothetical protein
MSGYVYLERDIFDHPLFPVKGPFPELLAWVWLFTHANYADGRYRFKGNVYPVPRGSYATSYRALAAAWHWSPDRVIRAVKLWEREGMVEVETRHGYVQLTICNYEAYQNRRDADATPTRQERDAAATVTSTNQRKERKVNKERAIPPYPPDFELVWDAFPKQRRGGKDAALAAWKKALTRATKEEIYAGVQAYCGSDEVRRGFAAGAARWLNDDRWTCDYTTVPSRESRGRRPGFTAAGDRLAARYAAEAERERQAAARPGPEPGLRLAEAVREDG